MTSKAAAIRYARALFDVAVRETQNLEAIEATLAAFADLFTLHPTLQKVLLNPAVPVPRKRATVVELTSALDTPPIVAKLLMLLAERDRLVLVPDLLWAYRERLLDHQNVVRAQITTATPLSTERTQQIEQRLAQFTGKKVTVSSHVDPSIIGGVIARIGGTVYDASLTQQLEKMRTRLVDG